MASRFGTALAPLLASTLPGAAQEAGAALPHDLSPWSMVLHADMVVKSVMVGLALASLVT